MKSDNQMDSSTWSMDSYRLFWEGSEQKEQLLTKEWGVLNTTDLSNFYQRVDDHLENWIPARTQS